MRIAIRHPFGLGLAALVAASTPSLADYKATNLVSDVAGLAANTDPNLKNPWGVASSPTGPFWVSDQANNSLSLYNGAGVPQALVVSTPTASSPPNGPTGQVFNNNASDFTLANGKGATFIAANLNGQVDAWNGGTAAQAVISGTGAVYTGLAIGTVAGDNVLYAADAAGSKIDVFGSNFAKLNGSTFANSFIDPSLPSGFRVYNIQNIGGVLYVAYDNPANAAAAANGGVVAEFTLGGQFLKQLIANGPGGPLQDAWGMTLAPAGFGQFGGDFLVGDKESGQINAFDPNTGAFLGLLATITNDPTSTNNGLWGLSFGNGGSAGGADTLYAFAGINNEADGLIVALTSVPEPGSIVLTTSGAAIASGLGLARRRRRPDRSDLAPG